MAKYSGRVKGSKLTYGTDSGIYYLSNAFEETAAADGGGGGGGGSEVPFGVSYVSNVWADANTLANMAATSSTQGPTNGMCWQPFKALTNIAFNKVRIGTYLGGNNSPNIFISQSISETSGFNIPIKIADSSTSGISYVAGGVSEITTSNQNISAGTYFLIGFLNGPYYKTIRNVAVLGESYITAGEVEALPYVFIRAHENNSNSDLPTQVGGNNNGTAYTKSLDQAMSIGINSGSF